MSLIIHFLIHDSICDREKIYETTKQTNTEVGQVSMFVNSEGIVSRRALLDTPDEKIIRTFDVNIMAYFWTMKTFMPDMNSHKQGHMINITSLAFIQQMLHFILK